MTSDERYNGLAAPSEDGVNTYATGAKASNDADGVRFDLLPQLGLKSAAAAMALGVRYGEHNWKKGLAWSINMNHILKHINDYLMGDTSQDHIGHATARLMMQKDYETIRPEMNDLDWPSTEKAVFDSAKYGE